MKIHSGQIVTLCQYSHTFFIQFFKRYCEWVIEYFRVSSRDIACSGQLIFGTYIRNQKSINLCSIHSTSVHLAWIHKAQMFRRCMSRKSVTYKFQPAIRPLIFDLKTTILSYRLRLLTWLIVRRRVLTY